MATKQGKSGSQPAVFWKNLCSLSTRYCRPIRFKYVKESLEVTKQEIDEIRSEIDASKPYVNKTGTKNITIKYHLLLTMIDGKIANALTHTSSQVCYLCGTLSSQMNDLQRIEKRVQW